MKKEADAGQPLVMMSVSEKDPHDTQDLSRRPRRMAYHANRNALLSDLFGPVQGKQEQFFEFRLRHIGLGGRENEGLSE